MAKRGAVGKGDYKFPKEDNWQMADLVLALVSFPLVLWAAFNRKLLSSLELHVINVALDALNEDTEEYIRKKQLATFNISQTTYSKHHSETVLMRWRPWGYLVQRRNPLNNLLRYEASILATVRLKIDESIVSADLICAWGVLTYIDFDTDIYDFQDRGNFETLEVDTESVAIDQNGRFIKSLGRLGS